MAIFALVVLDKDGNKIGMKPEGAQFQDGYLEGIVEIESKFQPPHPNSFDIGDYHLLTLWSGIEPFIILPGYLVGLVCDTAEDVMSIKKALRKITNNVLLKLQDEKFVFNSYMIHLWKILSEGRIATIELERPDTSEPNNSAPVNSASNSNTLVQDDTFGDLLEMSSDIEDSSNQDSSSNPFTTSIPTKSGSNSQDPFGGGSKISDPFGGSSLKTDTFDGSSSSPTGLTPVPKKSTSRPTQISSPVSKPSPILTPKPKPKPKLKGLDYDPSLFGTPKTMGSTSTDSSDSFAANPWGDEQDPSSSGGNDEPFSSDPFASNSDDEEKEKEKKKDIDPFESNPFG